MKFKFLPHLLFASLSLGALFLTYQDPQGKVFAAVSPGPAFWNSVRVGSSGNYSSGSFGGGWGGGGK